MADIADTIARERPALVVPGDDRACEYLNSVEALSARSADPAQRWISDCIAQSLGMATGRALGLLKSRFVGIACEEGIRVPSTQPVPDVATLRRLLAKETLPIVLKQDASHGGQGVRIADDRETAERAFADLQLRADSTVALQAFVAGVPANRAVFCWRGEVLAGISVEVVQTMTRNGPASVVRLLDSLEMQTAAERLVRRLGLSGFIGFDFIRTGEGDTTYLLEMNARPTQICHWALGPAQDPIGALKGVLSGDGGVPDGPRPLAGAGGTIALFPWELWRDPASAHLSTATHDRPDHLGAFVAAYSRPVPEDPYWLSELRTRIRSHTPVSVAG